MKFVIVVAILMLLITLIQSSENEGPELVSQDFGKCNCKVMQRVKCSFNYSANFKLLH